MFILQHVKLLLEHNKVMNTQLLKFAYVQNSDTLLNYFKANQNQCNFEIYLYLGLYWHVSLVSG